jgi:hypothetical protein
MWFMHHSAPPHLNRTAWKFLEMYLAQWKSWKPTVWPSSIPLLNSIDLRLLGHISLGKKFFFRPIFIRFDCLDVQNLPIICANLLRYTWYTFKKYIKPQTKLLRLEHAFALFHLSTKYSTSSYTEKYIHWKESTSFGHRINGTLACKFWLTCPISCTMIHGYKINQIKSNITPFKIMNLLAFFLDSWSLNAYISM